MTTVTVWSETDIQANPLRSGEKLKVSVKVQPAPCVHGWMVQLYADAPML